MLDGSSELQPMLTRHATHFDLFDKLEQQIAQAERVPAAEVRETNEGFQISLELPGVDRQSIDIKATERSLVVTAQRCIPTFNSTEDQNQTAQQSAPLVNEFRYGTWSRSFRFPRGINRDQLKANYKDGLLHINAPKAESNAAVTVAVEG